MPRYDDVLVLDTKKLVKKAEDIAYEKLVSATEKAGKDAQSQFWGATYDGVIDADVKVFKYGKGAKIIATGDSVPFIEYGTGHFVKPGYINDTTGEPYWFFNLESDAVLNSTGEHARYKRMMMKRSEDADKRHLYYKDTGKEVDYGYYGYEDGWDMYYDITESDDEDVVWQKPRSVRSDRLTPVESQFTYKDTPLEVRDDLPMEPVRDDKGKIVYEWVDKEYSARTYGNPPNNILSGIKDNFGQYLTKSRGKKKAKK